MNTERKANVYCRKERKDRRREGTIRVNKKTEGQKERQEGKRGG